MPPSEGIYVSSDAPHSLQLRQCYAHLRPLMVCTCINPRYARDPVQPLLLLRNPPALYGSHSISAFPGSSGSVGSPLVGYMKLSQKSISIDFYPDLMI